MRKIEQWPKDWDAHVSKTFELYFEDKEIELISSEPFFSIVTDATPKNTNGYKYEKDYLFIDLDINGISYSVTIEFKDYLLWCQIFIVEEKIIELPEKSYFKVMPYMYNSEIAAIISPNPFECVKLVEQAILMDYKERFGDDDNDDDNDEESIDIEPILPSSYTPTPVIA